MQLFYVKLTLYKKIIFKKGWCTYNYIVGTTANLLAECSFEIGKWTHLEGTTYFAVDGT